MLYYPQVDSSASRCIVNSVVVTPSRLSARPLSQDSSRILNTACPSTTHSLSSLSLDTAIMSLDTMTQAVWSSPNSFPSNPLEFAQPYCLPSHPCYPGLDAFAQLNDTLSGKLIKPREDLLASVANCSEARCADAAWRASEPGVSSQYTNFV